MSLFGSSPSTVLHPPLQHRKWQLANIKSLEAPPHSGGDDCYRYSLFSFDDQSDEAVGKFYWVITSREILELKINDLRQARDI
jgi:hypothetical protein